MKKKNRSKRLLIISLVIAFILYLPSLFEPISYGDECIYLTLGNAFSRGLVFYKDIHDNKPPLLYLVAAASGGSLFWFRFFSTAVQLLHLILIYKIVKFLTKKPFAAFASSLVFIFLSLIFEGRIANGEVFMMLPATTAVYLILKHPKKANFNFGFLIGFLFSLGFLFKIPVFFDLVGVTLGFWLLKLPKINLKSITKTITSKLFIGLYLGFTLPILTSIVYYSFHGAFTPYVRSALLQNIGYLSSWQGSNSGLLVRGIILLLLLLSIVVAVRKKAIPHLLGFLSIWFIFSLFGSLLSARPYPHYFIEIVPSLSIIIGLVITKAKFRYYLISILAIALLLISYKYFNFWWYPQLPYYKNFVAFLMGSKTSDEYYQYWGNQTKQNYYLANFIKKSTTANDRIFVWGDGPCIYAISKRLPPGRYTVNYHIFDFNGFEETIKAIEKNKPSIIIKMANEEREFKQLDRIIEEKYIRFRLEGVDAKIFLLKNGWLSKFK
jgi:hypothetical protein